MNPPIALGLRGRSSLPPGGTAGGQAIAVGGGSVWALGGDLVLYSISESNGEVTRLAEVRHANTLTYGMGALWVVTTDNTVLRVDPRSGRVTTSHPGARGQPQRDGGRRGRALGDRSASTASCGASSSGRRAW